MNQGMTLVEILISSVIGVGVAGATMALVLETGKENRRSLANAALSSEVDITQDRLVGLLRGMSASESTILGDPIQGGAFFQRLVVAQGQAPDWPREEIYFEESTNRLIHDPDRNQAGDEVILFEPNQYASLRAMHFFTSMKSGGIPDGSSINVWMEFDDDGFAGHRNPDGTLKLTQLARCFTVKMRQE